MSPTLYYTTESPPVRALLMTAKTIGLEFNLKQMKHSDTQSDWFIKINPQHTLPTLVEDDGFTLWDSHAIMAYIVSKYAKEDSLYPKDLQKRALVDQRLHFDNAVAFSRVYNAFRPIVLKNKRSLDQADLDSLEEVYGFLEVFLEGRRWVAGDNLTIADFSLMSTISTTRIFVNIDESKYPKVVAWFKQSESLPVYEVNKKGLEAQVVFLKQFLDALQV